MSYVRRIIQGAISVNNSELRIRYTNNFSGMHMGHAHGRGPKYRYEVIDGEIQSSFSVIEVLYVLGDARARHVSSPQSLRCFIGGRKTTPDRAHGEAKICEQGLRVKLGMGSISGDDPVQSPYTALVNPTCTWVCCAC